MSGVAGLPNMCVCVLLLHLTPNYDSKHTNSSGDGGDGDGINTHSGC